MFLKFDKKYFDRVFTGEDPWHYSLSDYERVKYLRQLEAIQGFYPQPQSILEVGCAEGVFTGMLSEAFPQAKITGVDISATAIARAREKYQDHPNVEFIEADAIQLFRGGLLPDQRFDVIIQSASLHYIFVRLLFQRKLHSYLSGISNRLKENGVFLTSNELNIQTRFMLRICYFILGKLCQPELAVKYREWSDFREKHLSYDLRVFRATSTL
ncbi:MAG: Trans-aconitate 2-methyltransferase [Chloroflexi bacterium]|nr:Trans-aconitate 2-methyltransferase [Chloroflexota bacterium]